MSSRGLNPTPHFQSDHVLGAMNPHTESAEITFHHAFWVGAGAA